MPAGLTVENAPSDLISAIDQALKILSWQENLPSDEMPPRWMWHLDWELEAHFTKIKNERDRKFAQPSSSSDSGDHEEGDMWDDNAFSARFKR